MNTRRRIEASVVLLGAIYDKLPRNSELRNNLLDVIEFLSNTANNLETKE